VHEREFVPPEALVKYFPALQAVQTEAPLAENHPLGHCKQRENNLYYALFKE
jgi:hypothetical protein